MILDRAYKKHAQIITLSFIIHVDFDRVWAEHYPVTLMQSFTLPAVSIGSMNLQLQMVHLFQSQQ
jgi:hypothetical protein